MRLPKQAIPVMRTISMAKATGAGIVPQGCSVWDKIKCASVIIGCAGACVVTDGAACGVCMGSEYELCKDCL